MAFELIAKPYDKEVLECLCKKVRQEYLRGNNYKELLLMVAERPTKNLMVPGEYMKYYHKVNKLYLWLNSNTEGRFNFRTIENLTNFFDVCAYYGITIEWSE